MHPDEGPVAIQFFGSDPDVMREAAAIAAGAGPDLIDLNMGCPVPKVLKTGAGAALIADPEHAVAVARAAGEGSGLPVTVKLRSGIAPGTTPAWSCAGGWSPTPASRRSPCTRARPKQFHRGRPEYELVARAARRLDAAARGCPVIVSGGLRDAERARARLRAVRRRRRDDRPRLARQPVDLRAADRRADRAARRGGDRGRASLGARSGGEHWGACAPRATCASSIPGTSSGSATRAGRLTLPAHRQPGSGPRAARAGPVRRRACGALGRRSRIAIIRAAARPASGETRGFRAFLCRETAL